MEYFQAVYCHFKCAALL